MPRFTLPANASSMPDAEVRVRDCEIQLLQVYHGKFQGKGTALTKQAEAYLRDVKKCHKSYVYCTSQTKAFWQKMGYTVETPWHLGGSPMCSKIL